MLISFTTDIRTQLQIDQNALQRFIDYVITQRMLTSACDYLHFAMAKF